MPGQLKLAVGLAWVFFEFILAGSSAALPVEMLERVRKQLNDPEVGRYRE